MMYDEGVATVAANAGARSIPLTEALNGAQHFYISTNVRRVIQTLWDDIFGIDANTNGVMPMSSRLPADRCVFHLESFDEEIPVCGRALTVLCQKCPPDGAITTDVVVYQGSVPVRIVYSGGYFPGQSGSFQPLPPKPQVTLDHVLTVTRQIAACCTLIAEPSLVKFEAAHNRQVRRQLERAGQSGEAVARRVVWTLLSEYEKTHGKGISEKKMPLHFRRGHPRRAAPHFVGAYLLTNALRHENNGKWVQWIEGRWKGHPAFGVVRHDYAPKVPFGGGAV
jgi:hypothetical protein